ncbi:multidrug ABC transporter permease [Paenibacillus oryzae]|uniref:Multidrug ABC transporter permease n=1 Tax=Paenibacillus oryzae TaxID=1844972 RepID=A0A1A5YA31_9BACL|nr:ABC transporter permease [Paenibacillus oryzae]OBR62423.1 multidrug ABC transporter permease [Paenibacillus oryzae]
MIGSILRKELSITFKEKGTFFWLFVLPILFIVMFSAIFSNTSQEYAVRYYDADHSVASEQLLNLINQVEGFKLQNNSNEPLDDQLEGIRSGKISSLLVIPKGYGESLQSGATAKLELYRDAADDNASAPVSALLGNIVSQYKEVKLAAVLEELGQQGNAVENILTSPVELQEMKESAVKIDTVTQVVPGYTVMFVFFIMITMVRNFLRDKNSGMLARLSGTPMRSHHYLIGMWVPNIVVVLIQCTVLLLFGKIVYGLQLGDISAVALLICCLAVCCTGIGLMLSMLVRSENQGIGFVQIITMGGAIVGGLWFPYDFLPEFVRMIGKFTPQFWAQRGLQDVMLRGMHIDGIWLNATILLGIGFVGLGIALLGFRRFANGSMH